MLENNVRTFADRNRILVYIVLSSMMLYFIFASAVNVLYYAGDDFRYSLGGFDKACIGDDGFGFMKTIGRPIQAYLDCASYKFAYTVERMKIIRMLSVVLMGCGMGLLADLLFSFGFSLGSAFFAAGMLFLVQHLYGDSILTGSCPLPASIVLVLLAYKCIYKSHAYLVSQASNFKRRLWIGISAILVFCSLLTYPSMTFLFSVLILSKLLFSRLADWGRVRQEIWREMVLFGVVCCVYFCWAFYNMHYHAEAPITPQYNLSHPNLNIIEMLNRFLNLANVFNGIWSVSPVSNVVLQAKIMLALILGGAILGAVGYFRSHFYRDNKEKGLAIWMQAVLLGCALIVLSSAFSLIIPLKDTGARLLYGAIACGIMLSIWGITQWFAVFPKNFRNSAIFLVVTLFFLIQGYQANLSLSITALGYADYFHSVKSEVASYLAKEGTPRRIHFIIPTPDYPYDRFFLANGVLKDLLGHSYSSEWCSLARGVPGAEKDHQAESNACINKLPRDGIGITYSYTDEPFQKTERMLLLNMENVRVATFSARYRDYFMG